MVKGEGLDDGNCVASKESELAETAHVMVVSMSLCYQSYHTVSNRNNERENLPVLEVNGLLSFLLQNSTFHTADVVSCSWPPTRSSRVRFSAMQWI
jgi:hypothetical protein